MAPLNEHYHFKVTLWFFCTYMHVTFFSSKFWFRFKLMPSNKKYDIIKAITGISRLFKILPWKCTI